MLHRRLALTGIALCSLSLSCQDQGNGDPGRDFQNGTGSYYPTTSGATGYGGRRGTGYAGGGGSGAASGAAGSYGGAGSTADGGAGTMISDGGADVTASDGGGDGSGTAPAACVPGATATFSLAWSLEDASGADSTCDGVGGKTVDIDVVNSKTGAEALATIPCGALAATTCGMPAGTYSISMKLRDAAGNVLSEVVAPLMFLVDGQNTAVTSLPLQVGGDATQGRGFAATWSIDKVGSGAIESCTQAGAVSVRLTVGQSTFDLPCANGKGRTTAVAPGTYVVKLDLIDATMAALSETQTMNVSIAAGQLVFLGDVPFDVN
jgi:hypothetical protein